MSAMKSVKITAQSIAFRSVLILAGTVKKINLIKNTVSRTSVCFSYLIRNLFYHQLLIYFLPNRRTISMQKKPSLKTKNSFKRIRL
jgi:hypothetical protein